MKRFISFSLSFVLLVFCCGCSLFEKNTYVDLTESCINDEGIVFYTEKDTYPRNVEEIKFTFGYEGDERGVIITEQDRQALTLHKLIDGEWKRIEYRKDYVYSLVYVYPSFHESGKMLELCIHTNCFITPLEKGTYRVAIKGYIPTDDTYFENGEFLYDVFQGDGKVFVSEPFEIE